MVNIKIATAFEVSGTSAALLNALNQGFHPHNLPSADDQVLDIRASEATSVHSVLPWWPVWIWNDRNSQDIIHLPWIQ